ncbi:MAG: hypothetical protein WBO39_08050 [Ferruginibacter sp.]
MKKNLTLFLCSLLFSTGILAQVSKDSLLKVIVKETCTDITGKDFSGKSMEEIEMELGLAMMPIMVKYQEELQTAFGTGIEDQAGMEKMGMEVGLQLAKDCPAFLKMFAGNPAVIKERAGKNAAAELKTVNGKLLAIVHGDFSYLQVKDAAGKIEKLWWMEYFEGSGRLITNAGEMLNKDVKVKYSEKEIYNATLKEYIKIKVIAGLE